MCMIFFFFFQAEDGIRDADVTGVQTCALPIWPEARGQQGLHHGGRDRDVRAGRRDRHGVVRPGLTRSESPTEQHTAHYFGDTPRAPCCGSMPLAGTTHAPSPRRPLEEERVPTRSPRSLAVVVLAAGMGKRLKSSRPKVL